MNPRDEMAADVLADRDVIECPELVDHDDDIGDELADREGR